MPYPLKPQIGTTEPDQLLEIFLGYVASKGLELYPAQEEALLELFDGKHVILNTPTGSGKSLVAAGLHFLSASTGRRSVYTCPIKALVNEKFLAMCRDFGPDQVGMMTGDASVNRGAPILCCTAEILANIALRDGPNATVMDVVMDEFHYYSDAERGVAWQAPLLTMSKARFLLMSATLGETRFFEKEMTRLTGQPAVTVRGTERPVPLAFEYLEEPLLDTLEDLQKRDRLPVYVVHFTQRSASETAQNLLSSLNPCTKAEKGRIAEALEGVAFTSPFGKEVKKLIRNGIGLHHAGLLPKYRVLIERLAQEGLLKIICGTDTLGVGVNVPIRTVLFTQLCKYDGAGTGILAARDFHQICGRAGRKGFDDQGYVYALAPEHVIENKRLEARAAADPKKAKKLVKKKPPTHGYVHWDGETFARLQVAPPEPLQSRFAVNHGMLLNVLGRQGDGCLAMRQLIGNCHEGDSSKAALRKRAFKLFRSLVDRNIIEILPRGSEPKLRVNVELQDEFSLNQALGLYCIDTLGLLDTTAAEYPFKLVSLVEAILEDPDAILRKQLDKLKTEKMAEMKAAGIEYEERLEELEKLEHPKPERDLIYTTFNQFAAEHPWIGEAKIRPKSIAREMFERYSSFSDYVKLYGLMRTEGLLLRHLTNVYRVLVHTVPTAFRNEAVDEVITYLEELLRATDSSLLDEWERLRDPAYVSNPGAGERVPVPKSRDLILDEKGLEKMVRHEVFRFLRLLENGDYDELEEVFGLKEVFPDASWPKVEMEKLMTEYREEHGWIRLDPPARNKAHTRFFRMKEERKWMIEHTLIDSYDLNDHELSFELLLDGVREKGEVALRFLGMRRIGAP
ncbi:MAG: DEAD/DEAH box helicase [Puniceicoccaceae bacterium]